MADLTAYQEFMLRGKYGGGEATAPSTPIGRTPQNDSSSSGKKRGKNEMVVFRAFQGRLQEWKDLDSQLDAVLGSIANLRDRIWWETKHLDHLAISKPWESLCFRSTSRFASYLHSDDVELALSHDLLQHERMLSTSRTLMASMAQTQDGMGRRLDEWMMMQLDYPLSELGYSSLEQAQSLYVFLAAELYRKQELVKKVLDSCHDGLVEQDAVDDFGNPRTISRQCCVSWDSTDSEMIQIMRQMLEA